MSFYGVYLTNKNWHVERACDKNPTTLQSSAEWGSSLDVGNRVCCAKCATRLHVVHWSPLLKDLVLSPSREESWSAVLCSYAKCFVGLTDVRAISTTASAPTHESETECVWGWWRRWRRKQLPREEFPILREFRVEISPEEQTLVFERTIRVTAFPALRNPTWAANVVSLPLPVSCVCVDIQSQTPSCLRIARCTEMAEAHLAMSGLSLVSSVRYTCGGIPTFPLGADSPSVIVVYIFFETTADVWFQATLAAIPKIFGGYLRIGVVPLIGFSHPLVITYKVSCEPSLVPNHPRLRVAIHTKIARTDRFRSFLVS